MKTLAMNHSNKLFLLALSSACAWGCGNSAGSPADSGGATSVAGTGGGATSGTAGKGSAGASQSGGGASGGGATGAGGTITATAGSGTAGTSSPSGGATSDGGSAPGGGAGFSGEGGSTGGSMSGSGGGAAGGGAGTAGNGGAATQSAGCGTMPMISSSQYNKGQHIAISAAGMQREYILNVPTNYDNTHPYRLVIAYHELNGNDDEMYRNGYYHLLSLSNESTIFVAPNGQQSGKNCTAASGCGWPNPNDSDMLLADAVVAQIEQNFCVDKSRIFATGWSYGASMSYETACERPLGGTTNGVAGYIRAIAGYSAAQLSGSCKPSKPVAYYASHGTNDSVLPYSGGVNLAHNMVTVDGCSWMTPTQATGSHVCTNFTGCSAGHPVEFCSFVGPHTPDPTDSGQRTSWEYQNVWTFLSQF